MAHSAASFPRYYNSTDLHLAWPITLFTVLFSIIVKRLSTELVFPHGRVHKNQTPTVEERELALSHGPHGFVFHSMMMLKDDDDADHNDADDKFSLQMNLSHTIF